MPSLTCQWGLKVCTTAVIFFKIYFAHESVHNSLAPRKVAGEIIKRKTGSATACTFACRLRSILLPIICVHAHAVAGMRE